MNEEEILDEVIGKSEGDKFVDDPDDRGGPSKFGITKKTPGLGLLLDHKPTTEDIKNLTEPQARHIYRIEFIQGPGFFKIKDDRIRYLAVDSGIHHGPQRVIGWFQEATGVTVDGILGPKTEAAINGADQDLLYDKILARRLRFIGWIIANKRGQAKFAGGWTDRIARFIEG